MKGNEEIINTNNNNFIYRKDSFYKHFKSIFVKYLKDKINRLKNICFPNFDKNNFSSLVYKYTENPKEKDNYKFLSFRCQCTANPVRTQTNEPGSQRKDRERREVQAHDF